MSFEIAYRIVAYTRFGDTIYAYLRRLKSSSRGISYPYLLRSAKVENIQTMGKCALKYYIWFIPCPSTNASISQAMEPQSFLGSSHGSSLSGELKLISLPIEPKDLWEP